MTATGDLLIRTITLTGTAFQKTVNGDGCSNQTLTPGQTCTVSVLFKPGSTGAKSSTLSIPSNDPDSRESGEGCADRHRHQRRRGRMGPGHHGDARRAGLRQHCGRRPSLPQAVTIQNDGTGDLILRAITLTGTQFQKPLALDGCANTTLTPGQSCTVSVVSRPTTAGAKTSKLSIQSNDPNPFENPARVDLIGSGQ